MNYGFPGGSVVKTLSSARGRWFVSWVEKFIGEGNSNPLQYSPLGNPMDRGAWQSIVHGITKSQTHLSN